MALRWLRLFAKWLSWHSRSISIALHTSLCLGVVAGIPVFLRPSHDCCARWFAPCWSPIIASIAGFRLSATPALGSRVAGAATVISTSVIGSIYAALMMTVAAAITQENHGKAFLTLLSIFVPIGLIPLAIMRSSIVVAKQTRTWGVLASLFFPDVVFRMIRQLIASNPGTSDYDPKPVYVTWSSFGEFQSIIWKVVGWNVASTFWGALSMVLCCSLIFPHFSSKRIAANLQRFMLVAIASRFSRLSSILLSRSDPHEEEDELEDMQIEQKMPRPSHRRRRSLFSMASNASGSGSSPSSEVDATASSTLPRNWTNNDMFGISFSMFSFPNYAARPWKDDIANTPSPRKLGVIGKSISTEGLHFLTEDTEFLYRDARRAAHRRRSSADEALEIYAKKRMRENEDEDTQVEDARNRMDPTEAWDAALQRRASERASDFEEFRESGNIEAQDERERKAEGSDNDAENRASKKSNIADVNDTSFGNGHAGSLRTKKGNRSVGESGENDGGFHRAKSVAKVIFGNMNTGKKAGSSGTADQARFEGNDDLGQSAASNQAATFDDEVDGGWIGHIKNNAGIIKSLKLPSESDGRALLLDSDVHCDLMQWEPDFTVREIVDCVHRIINALHQLLFSLQCLQLTIDGMHGRRYSAATMKRILTPRALDLYTSFCGMLCRHMLRLRISCENVSSSVPLWCSFCARGIDHPKEKCSTSQPNPACMPNLSGNSDSIQQVPSDPISKVLTDKAVGVPGSIRCTVFDKKSASVSCKLGDEFFAFAEDFNQELKSLCDDIDWADQFKKTNVYNEDVYTSLFGTQQIMVSNQLRHSLFFYFGKLHKSKAYYMITRAGELRAFYFAIMMLHRVYANLEQLDEELTKLGHLQEKASIPAGQREHSSCAANHEDDMEHQFDSTAEGSQKLKESASRGSNKLHRFRYLCWFVFHRTRLCFAFLVLFVRGISAIDVFRAFVFLVKNEYGRFKRVRAEGKKRGSSRFTISSIFNGHDGDQELEEHVGTKSSELGIRRVTGHRLKKSRYLTRGVRYGFKVWLAMALTSVGIIWVLTILPQYRLEWIYVTVSLIFSPRVEATWGLSVNRILGTVFGGVVGGLVMSSKTVATSPALLSLISFVVLFFPSATYYNVAISRQYAVFLFIITYQIVIFCQYNGTTEGKVSFATERTMSVLIGNVIAICVNRLIWPMYARDEIEASLSAALDDSSDWFGSMYEAYFARTKELYSRVENTGNHSTTKSHAQGEEQEPVSGVEVASIKPTTTTSTVRFAAEPSMIEPHADGHMVSLASDSFDDSPESATNRQPSSKAISGMIDPESWEEQIGINLAKIQSHLDAAQVVMHQEMSFVSDEQFHTALSCYQLFVSLHAFRWSLLREPLLLNSYKGTDYVSYLVPTREIMKKVCVQVGDLVYEAQLAIHNSNIARHSIWSACFGNQEMDREQKLSLEFALTQLESARAESRETFLKRRREIIVPLLEGRISTQRYLSQLTVDDQVRFYCIFFSWTVALNKFALVGNTVAEDMTAKDLKKDRSIGKRLLHALYRDY